ncbi:MAG: hypothetical protein ACLR23_05670 [Clostridia bacterium]|jgi:hypothetical protein|uniref:Uncharacterized protein n=1 Tax=Bianquea renquensis TaxID=2763661 RepID=A0A926DVQ3_9FIRM|nr:hypothetical protein [Bianquea renquensis]MBC8544722.1 hypothetical protein [Bianquea renquensis]
MRYRGRGIIVSKHKGNALFYRLKTKLPVEIIQSIFLCKPESLDQVPAHWEKESQWLADWEFSSIDLFESYQIGSELEVEYEIKSTSYSHNVRHGNVDIGPFRNLNVTKVRRYMP